MYNCMYVIRDLTIIIFRFDTQVAANKILESQLEALRKKIKEKKAELKEVAAGGGRTYKKSDLTKLIIKLQREKNNLESKIHVVYKENVCSVYISA